MRYLVVFIIFSFVLVIAIYANLNPNLIESFNKYFFENNKDISASENNNKIKSNSESSKELFPDAPKEKPKFDIVRVTKEGSSVIAGKGPPLAIVKVFEGKNLIGETKANEDGDWVLIPKKNFEPGNKELTIKTISKDGTKLSSDQVVIISVPKPEGSDSKPVVLLTDQKKLSPTKILQNDNKLSLDNKKNIVIDIIDYNESGNVILSGRTLPNSKVQVYLDNKLLNSVQSDQSGIWIAKLYQQIEEGNYELKVELIQNNIVTGIAITPFTRINIEKIKFEKGNVIVQPGNSLWRIARKVYGSGFRYTIIFEANKNKINNPDLIFPGQIFKLPKTN